DVEDVEGVSNRCDECPTDRGSPHRAVAAEERRAAEHDHRHDVEQDPRVDVVLSRPELRRREDPAEAAAEAREDERAAVEGLHAEPREAARLAVAADRVDLLAVDTAREDDPEQDECPEHHHACVGDRVPASGAEAEEVLPIDVVRHVSRQDLRDAREGERHAERRDERVDARDRHDQGVDEADSRAEPERSEERDPGIVVLPDRGGQHGAQVEVRSDRQVDPAGDQHEGEPGRHHARRGPLARDVEQVVATDEDGVLRCDGRHENREGDDDAVRPDELDPVAAQRGSAGTDGAERIPPARPLGRDVEAGLAHAASASRSTPNANSRIVRTVQLSPSSRPSERPRPSTRIRSETSTTSSSSEEANSTDSPSEARRSMIVNMSAFAPMSIPAVGSSRSRIFGCRPSVRPTTSFCWLPPDRNAASTFSRRESKPSGVITPAAYSTSFRPWRRSALETAAGFVRATFEAPLSPRTRPYL